MLSEMNLSNSKEAYQTCKRVLTLNRQFNKTARIQALRHLADLAPSFEDHSAGIKYARQAIKEIKELKLPESGLTAIAYLSLANACIRDNNVTEARVAYTNGIAYLKSLKNAEVKKALSEMYYRRAILDALSNRPDSAIEDAKAALKYLDVNTWPEKEFKQQFWSIQCTWIQCLIAKNKLPEASSKLKSLIDSNKPFADDLPQMLANLANFCTESHKIDCARNLVRSAQLVLKKVPDNQKVTASVLVAEAYLESFSGNKEEAHKKWTVAAALVKGSLSDKRDATELSLFNNKALLSGEFEIAESTSKDLLDLSGLNDPSDHNGCLAAFTLSEIYKVRGNTAESKKYLEMAQTYVEKFKANDPALYKHVMQHQPNDSSTKKAHSHGRRSKAGSK